MISFFIADLISISKQKIKTILIKRKFSYVLFRNRGSMQTLNDYKESNFFATTNIRPMLKTKVRGIHFSLFHDKLISKIPLFQSTNKTASVHNLQQIIKVQTLCNPEYIFISPIYSTKTHPNAKTLSRVKLFKILNKTSCKNFILLGGMNFDKTRQLKRLDTHNKIKGFASISEFI